MRGMRPPGRDYLTDRTGVLMSRYVAHMLHGVAGTPRESAENRGIRRNYNATRKGREASPTIFLKH